MSDNMIHIIINALSVATVVVGWTIASKIKRDEKRREIKTKFLSEAYLTLAHEFSQRDPNEVDYKKIQLLVSKIQLYGDRNQVEMVKKMCEQISNNENFDLDPLLNSLRNSLRKDLNLEEIKSTTTWLR